MAIILACTVSWGVPVNVNEQTQYQTILGFGGHDPNSDAATLVNDLGISAHRSWIDGSGSSSPSWAVTKQMYDLGVRTFIACPWSPPAGLKYVNNESGTDSKWNRLSNGLGPLNDFRHPNADPEKGGMGNMYPAWAKHMADWVRNFRTNVGTDLFAICPQNEPAFAQPYPSCVFNAYQLRDAVGYLWDTLQARGYPTKVAAGDGMLGTFNGDNFGGAIMGFNDNYTGAAKCVDFLTVHGYGSNGATPTPSQTAALAWGGAYNFCNATSARNVARKKVGLWMTETSGYDNWTGGTSPDDGSAIPGAWALAIDIYNALKYGKIEAWFWWRLSVTSAGWRDEALMLNHQKLKTYYASKQYYRYVRPGAVHIKCDAVGDSAIWPIAFNDKPNRTLVVVALNSGNASKTITLAGASMPTSYRAYRTSSNEDCIEVTSGAVSGQNITLPAQSITTIVGTGYNPPAVGVGSRVAIASRISGACRATVYDISGRVMKTMDGIRAEDISRLAAVNSRGQALPRGTYCVVATDAAGNAVVGRSTIEIR